MVKKSRTREARKRRQQQQKQQRQRFVIFGIIIVAILAVALLIVSNQPIEAVVPQDLEARYEGLDRSLSSEGYPRIGDPDAPVTVREYSSFSCPGCEAFHDITFGSILDRVKQGQVLFVYVPLQTGSIPNAPGAARAALCAGQQGKFWEMHDVLFAWHTQYANTAFSQNRLLAGIEALGLDSGTFTTCFNSQSISNVLDSALSEGVASTPTIEVNGITVSGESGSIPSTQEVLAAIDNATPRDWSPTTSDAGDEVPEEAESSEPEATETVDETADVEATDEADVPVEDEDTEEETDTTEAESDAEAEATEESSD